MKVRAESPYTSNYEISGSEFDRGRSYANWRPRGTRDWLLIYTEEGAGRLASASAEGPTQPGEVTLYAPGERQDYKTDTTTGRWHLLWSHFTPRPSWKPWLGWPIGRHGVKSLYLEEGDVRDGFVAALRRMINAFRRRMPDFTANALEEALLWTRVAASREGSSRSDPRVREAMDYLIANLQEPYQLEKLARHCGLSVSRLAHLFKASTGSSPQQYFEQQRMWHAGQLLRVTGLGIAEVAAEVGYNDPFYFSNRFRRYAGKSPSQFRLEKAKA